jgi:hypothetical protein
MFDIGVSLVWGGWRVRKFANRGCSLRHVRPSWNNSALTGQIIIIFYIWVCLEFDIWVCLEFDIWVCLEFDIWVCLEFDIWVCLEFDIWVCSEFDIWVCLEFDIWVCSKFEIWVCLEFDIWVWLENLPRKLKFHYDLTTITGTSHAGDRYTVLITSRSVLLRMRNVSDKSCTEKQNTHFVFSNFFTKIAPFMR